MIPLLTVTLIAIIAAVADPATDALAKLNALWLIVGAVLPFLYPFIVRAGAGKWFKLVLSVVLSVIVSFLTLIPQGGFSGMDFGEILIWATSFVGVVQVVYVAADKLVAQVTGNGGLNDLEVFRPERGLKGF